jgi:hypothetical protein
VVGPRGHLGVGVLDLGAEKELRPASPFLSWPSASSDYDDKRT